MGRPIFSDKLLLIIAMIAAAIGCLADYLLLYASSGNYHLGDYKFLLEIPLGRLSWGHYLGILFIPFELLGFYVFAKGFKPLGRRYPFLIMIVAIWLVTLGVAYHGMLAFVGQFLHEAPEKTLMLEQTRHLFEPLSFIMAVGFFVFAMLTILWIFQGKTDWTKKIIPFNPVLGYMVITLVYFAFPLIGNILMVMGFNLANLVFFGACLVFLPKWNS